MFDEVRSSFSTRKFAAGLFLAFIDLYLELDTPSRHIASFEDLLKEFPRREITAAKKRANTLILERRDGGTISLRGFYNKAERFFRDEKKRFDYPSCAPHATQAWQDYKGWLNGLLNLSERELNQLSDKVKEFVLAELPSQEFDPDSVRSEPPLYRLLLEGFSLVAPKGEPTGAAFQGVVFGFLRADNPHLQVEIDKVRTGSRRLQRVGDIDCWEGKRLAISAEVKSKRMDSVEVSRIAGFSNACQARGAIGVVAALEFTPDAIEKAEEMGLSVLELTDMVSAVRLWDPMKQRTAVSSFVYYATHVEKNSGLADRLHAFLTANEKIS